MVGKPAGRCEFVKLFLGHHRVRLRDESDDAANAVAKHLRVEDDLQAFSTLLLTYVRFGSRNPCTSFYIGDLGAHFMTEYVLF